MATTDVLRRTGVEIVHDYLSTRACHLLLRELRHYESSHALPLIERAESERSLRYRVIDGDRVLESLPGLVRLYGEVLALVRSYDPNLAPLPNSAAGVNVNFTPPGGQYRWHYDRNSITAVLFLNTVQGGEIEMYPRFRIRLGRWKDRAIQRVLDGVVRRFVPFVKPMVVVPSPGKMILMQADRCLHSVRKVEGKEERVSIIMAFDPPGAVFTAQRDLDSYLYSGSASPHGDPNYRL